MRIYRYGLLTGLVLWLCISAFKQPDDYTIIITTLGNGAGHSRCTIKGNKGELTITYFRRDSIYYQQVSKDKAYPQALKDTMAWGDFDKLKAILKAHKPTIDSLYDLHSKHIEQKVKLSLAQQPRYFKQVDSLLHADSTVLLATPKTSRNGMRIVLDGTHYTFNINANGNRRNLYVHAPNNNYYGPLYRFINSTAVLTGQKID